jgi:hypothetical protein
MTKENPENHKASISPVITQTVLSILPDLSHETRQKLLENQTPEELIVSCKEKYDREFDLHFSSLGAAGAHEVAWSETMALLNDDFWS